MSDQSEHAVLIQINLDGDEFGTPEEQETVYQIEEALEDAAEASGAGEYDGHEFGEGQATIYMYGPDADRLAATALGVLRGFDLPKGSTMTKRYGEPGEREEQVAL